MRDALTALLVQKDESIPLDLAALELATIEFPELEIPIYLDELDFIASTLTRRLSHTADGRAYVVEANRYLFEELRFQGNSSDYYHPHNSCLNQVLATRRGLPITLAIVYMEVARRLGRPVFGIGLPGHFVAQYDDGDYATFIDPFHGGKLLSPMECFELAHRMSGTLVPPDMNLLKPVGKRHILMRMLNNLRAVYFHQKAHAKVTAVLDLMIAAHPESPEEYKQRAASHLQQGRYRSAAVDLASYLERAPEATDREEIEKQMLAIRRYASSLN